MLLLFTYHTLIISSYWFAINYLIKNLKLKFYIMLFNAIFSCISYYPYITCRGKWGKVMTRGKVIFGPAGFNIQMTSFEKEQKLVILLLDIF